MAPASLLTSALRRPLKYSRSATMRNSCLILFAGFTPKACSIIFLRNFIFTTSLLAIITAPNDCGDCWRSGTRRARGEPTFFPTRNCNITTKVYLNRSPLWPRYQLSSCVKMIEKIWRKHGGEGVGSYYNPLKEQHDGPLLRLLLELFEQTGLPDMTEPPHPSQRDTRQQTPPSHCLTRHRTRLLRCLLCATSRLPTAMYQQ